MVPIWVLVPSRRIVDQDGELQLAGRAPEGVRDSVISTRMRVAQRLFSRRSFTWRLVRYLLSLDLAGERRGVHADADLDGRLFDDDAVNATGSPVGDGVAVVRLVDAGDGDDVARLGRIFRDALQPSNQEQCLTVPF